ncbi:MAG: peptidoglycan-binding protein [Alphaproteobacteria bacterium]|nr:peptidoglycan-binding protein [Alphaproteobacteria bacterium]
MPSFSRALLVSASILCLALAPGAASAAAPTVACAPVKHHVKKHRRTRHTVRRSAVVRIVQKELADLGYYTGRIDGIMGPQTRRAIKEFQSHQGLKADGIAGPKTRAALKRALQHLGGEGQQSGAVSPLPPLVVIQAPPPSNGQPVNPTYASPLGEGKKLLDDRFGRVEATESGSGANKIYTVTLDGQKILTSDSQPSVIGISPVYNLGDEDAIVFTTYNPNDTGCMYLNDVLVMSGTGSKILPINNCTRDYTGRVEQGSLFLAFPERDDARVVGATYRLEGFSLRKL